ncbi:MAG: carbohydrate kinase family protein [Bacillota bacterium]|jgi:pseudouridine kinase|nr:carbohydrate kinase family protein [Bacillota bacterium]NLM08732.1 kinase [Clostridiales Family XIII bacterium]
MSEAKNKVVIIGGITVDIEGHPYGRLIYADSNPGKISVAYGGVGRNIAENLGRMGIPVSFFSVAGDDLMGRTAIRELSDLGVDVSGVRLLPDENTAMYISILNLVGDIEIGLSNMDALERISREVIDDAVGAAADAKMVVLDTNLTEDTLAYTIERFKGKPLFLDPVSTTKAKRAKDHIGEFHTIKPNRMEAEVLLDMEIRDPKALEEAGKRFIEKGVKQVFISLSAGGVYFTDGVHSELFRPLRELKSEGSATGAGDAFSAAVIYSFIHGYDMVKTARFSLAAASLAMESKTAVNPDLTVEEIERRSR